MSSVPSTSYFKSDWWKVRYRRRLTLAMWILFGRIFPRVRRRVVKMAGNTHERRTCVLQVQKVRITVRELVNTVRDNYIPL